MFKFAYTVMINQFIYLNITQNQVFMVKFLLSMAVALMATTAVAQAPSADELSKYSVRVDFVGDSIHYPTVGKSIVTYATEGSTATINIGEPTGLINLKAKYDEASTALTMYPQMAGMDDETYQYRMIVPASVKTQAPTAFGSATISGNLFDNMITYGPWNMILTSNFTDNKGVVYDKDISTCIFKPNCTVTLGVIEEDDANNYVYKKGAVQELRAYAEQTGKSVIVYNFDEMGGCLVINLNNNKSCTISSNDLVYKKNEKNVYKAFALAESTIGGEEVVKAENPDAAGVIEGGKQIKFGYVGLINTARYGYRGLYYQVNIALDNELDMPSGITDTQATKQVANVSYVNLAGMTSSTPFDGVNVKVIRYTDGSMNTQKVIVRK